MFIVFLHGDLRPTGSDSSYVPLNCQCPKVTNLTCYPPTLFWRIVRPDSGLLFSSLLFGFCNALSDSACTNLDCANGERLPALRARGRAGIAPRGSIRRRTIHAQIILVRSARRPNRRLRWMSPAVAERFVRIGQGDAASGGL